MSVVTEFAVGHEQFGLGDVFAAHPGLVLEVERTVAQPPARRLRDVWAIGARETVADSLGAAPTITDLSVQTEGPSGTLYEVAWTDAVLDPMAGVLDRGASIQRLIGEECGWTLQLRVPDRDRLPDLQSYFETCTAEISLQRLQEVDAESFDGRFQLTPTQRETLVAAERLGYYDIPRDVTMTELADELGVSQQAVSKRLRRGHASLTHHMLDGGSIGQDDGTDGEK